MKYFVICHDQKIADTSKLNNRLPKLQWVMVGNNKFNKGIIARKLKNNIEHSPYLVAYTAWYALVHNNYIDDNEWYGMFEYDVLVPGGFTQMIEDYLIPNYIIGFIPLTVDHILFMGPGTELLKNSIKDVYNLNVNDIIHNEIAKERILWCSTSNCIIQGKDIKGFVEWFDRLIPSFKRNEMAAHYPERAIRLYMAINNIEPICLKGIFKHEQKKSHKIEYAIR